LTGKRFTLYLYRGKISAVGVSVQAVGVDSASGLFVGVGGHQCHLLNVHQRISAFGVKSVHQLAQISFGFAGNTCRVDGLDLVVRPSHRAWANGDGFCEQARRDGGVDAGVTAVAGFSLDGWHSEYGHWESYLALSAFIAIGVSLKFSPSFENPLCWHGVHSASRRYSVPADCIALRSSRSSGVSASHSSTYFNAVRCVIGCCLTIAAAALDFPVSASDLAG
jgi:hypothetical protein